MTFFVSLCLTTHTLAAHATTTATLLSPLLFSHVQRRLGKNQEVFPFYFRTEKEDKGGEEGACPRDKSPLFFFSSVRYHIRITPFSVAWPDTVHAPPCRIVVHARNRNKNKLDVSFPKRRKTWSPGSSELFIRLDGRTPSSCLYRMRKKGEIGNDSFGRPPRIPILPDCIPLSLLFLFC